MLDLYLRSLWVPRHKEEVHAPRRWCAQQHQAVGCAGDWAVLRTRALRVLLPGGTARDVPAWIACFDILSDAVRAGAAVAADAHLYGPALTAYAS